MLSKPLRPSDIRKRNEKVVLNIIRERGVVSQTDVVQETKLMASSVLSIFTALQEQGLIYEDEKIDIPDYGQRGRKPKYFRIVPTAAYALGIDLTPHFFHLSLVDFAGNIVVSRQVDIDNLMQLDELYENIRESITRVIKLKRVPKKILLGLGMGIPGQVDSRNGICLRSPFFKDHENLPLASSLSKILRIPVYIHNNCSVITVSERRYRQNLEQYQSLLAVLMRTGVGGGFTEKDVHDYYNQVSTYEIGHIPYSLDGPVCHCGARGCIETQLGEDVLLEELNAVVPLPSIPDVDEEYLRNPAVQAILRRKGSLLYMILRSVYQAVFPDTILLISRSFALSSFLVEHLRTEAEKDRIRKFSIMAESYDPALYSRGAADLVWENYFHIEANVCV